MGSGYAKKKKEAKMLQEKFQQMQEELKNASAKGSAGSGLVSITLNGEHEITELKINPECIDPEEPEALEDLIKAAHSDALAKLSQNTPSGLPDLGALGSLF